MIIVESDFAPKDKGDDKKDDESILDGVCEDALLLAAPVDRAGQGSG